MNFSIVIHDINAWKKFAHHVEVIVVRVQGLFLTWQNKVKKFFYRFSSLMFINVIYLQCSYMEYPEI